MLGSMSKVLGQVQNLQEQLKKMTVEGSAGNGMVRIIMNCQQHVLGVRFNADQLDQYNPESLEQLIIEAFKQAQEKSKAQAKEEVQKITGFDLSSLPGMF
ncbi:YbaB/EbfC family nucleoid-associated protein [Desulforamulus ruminis]|uniref:Nucleoid-associated protein Desru_0156 n=1 Tax=Desulforamulus ruminis (strain ATCC 23193 / DSM 2154 / NCIMB 8452 / DL) TaxID=696281 RepID=F6DMP7_DESRL|nr:YbaB/EbfC family nucleoid-associated protein [Desulforamulus ruminis]AEG58455.1 Uncharacterized protein family UPF0133 [Desulforamulus ruminis DSM 2154]